MRVSSRLVPHLSGEGCETLCQLSCPPPASCASAILRLLLVRTSTAQALDGSACSPPDFTCKLVIAVVPAGPEQQAQDQSVPRQTSTASS